jgi:hypothetical protein
MNTSITDKLPIESIGDTIVDSVHRVGELVPDRVPTAVHDVVVDSVEQGRRIGRQLLDRMPTHQEPSKSKRWIAVVAVITLVGAAVVVWRIRSRRAEEAAMGRDDWSLHEAKASNRDVA